MYLLTYCVVSNRLTMLVVKEHQPSHRVFIVGLKKRIWNWCMVERLLSDSLILCDVGNLLQKGKESKQEPQ